MSDKRFTDTQRLDWLEAAFREGLIVDARPPLFTVRIEGVDWGEYNIRDATDAGLRAENLRAFVMNTPKESDADDQC